MSVCVCVCRGCRYLYIIILFTIRRHYILIMYLYEQRVNRITVTATTENERIRLKWVIRRIWEGSGTTRACGLPSCAANCASANIYYIYLPTNRVVYTGWVVQLSNRFTHIPCIQHPYGYTLGENTANHAVYIYTIILNVYKLRVYDGSDDKNVPSHHRNGGTTLYQRVNIYSHFILIIIVVI